MGLLLICCGVLQAATNAQTFTVLHAFQGTPSDGANPVAALILDPAGNLYGTTQNGGKTGYGTVFKINRAAQETVLHNFKFETPDGVHPVARLVRDGRGNLYGTTQFGGSSANNGVVFGLSASGSESILYTFKGGADGSAPLAGLVRDSKGNLYGTTFAADGTSPKGVVFKLTPRQTLPWIETVLHTFTGVPDGAGPEADLLLDSNGNLYGTTLDGGLSGSDHGTVFEVNNKGVESVLFAFNGGTQGGYPEAGLVMDSLGNLYGTASAGGAFDGGVVYRLSPNMDGTWTPTVIYNFCAVKLCADGSTPQSSLVMDLLGNLYGTTIRGGTGGIVGREGTVFELSPVGAGWVETVLYSFTGGTDGANPAAGLVRDEGGNLYGTTSKGGDLSACSNIGCGTVFKIVP